MKNAELEKESTIAMKSIKSNAEVETFYRFIHENNLRKEAHILMQLVVNTIYAKVKKKRKPKN